jgi:hypothetical protein
MRTKHLSVQILIIILLLTSLAGFIHGKVCNIFSAQAVPVSVEIPKVILQQGNSGSSTIYTNNTSAWVSITGNITNECWLDGWSYRKRHVINSSHDAGTNYQIKITIHYGSGVDNHENVYLNSCCREDFGDIRFTDDDGITLLDYWMERKVDGDYATFWVKVVDDLSTDPATIYVYYGNPTATTTSNLENTFIRIIDANAPLKLALPMDEGEGNMVYDMSGNLNNGTIYGATWVNGKYDKALSFDETDDYVSIPHSTSLTPSEKMSIAFWGKCNTLNAFQTFLGKSSYNSNGFRAFVDGNNKLEFEIINAMDYLVISYDSIDTNMHHFAFTYDGFNGRIYLDGNEIWAYLPNDDLDPVQYYGDSFSDSNGNRVWPWGIETWAGGPSAYFDGGQVRLIGRSTGDAVVLAIPDFAFKPIVKERLSYTHSFLVKLENVEGNGVRLIHQWFDSDGIIISTIYGSFETGTTDWHTISLTSTAPMTAVRGDILIELDGKGTVYIKEPKFYLTNLSDRLITPSTQPLLLAQTTDGYWKLNGIIDEVRIYNRTLTKEEIRDMFTHYPFESPYALSGQSIIRKRVDPEPSHGDWGNEEEPTNNRYVLRVVNQAVENWKVNLIAYSCSNLSRLVNMTISFSDGAISDQIIINNGIITQQEGPLYDLESYTTIYISIGNIQTTTSGTTYVHVYLKVLVPNTSVYNLLIITFEIS